MAQRVAWTPLLPPGENGQGAVHPPVRSKQAERTNPKGGVNLSAMRHDKSGEGQSLTDNPFAALEGMKDGLPNASAPAIPEKPVAEIIRPKTDAPFQIQRTRKGGMPLSLERRPGGKVATLIGNVRGDAEALLTLLKRKCGAGGVVRDGAVEIQGDHRNRIEAILREYLV